MKKVLVLSIDPDPHVEAVAKLLRNELATETIIINTNSLNKYSTITVEYLPDCVFTIVSGNSKHTLDGISAIWLRKPSLILEEIMPQGPEARAAQKFKFQEWRQTYVPLVLEARRRGIFIVSNYEDMVSAGYKLSQLQIANDTGFLIPQTLVSCDIDLIKKFIRSANKTITKVMGVPKASDGDFTKNFFTQPISLELFENYYQNRELDYPILVQEEIIKKNDIRVTVIGRRIFACSIDSQATEATKHDSRLAHPHWIKHEEHRLPDKIAGLCFDLCRKHGLQYGAIDLALTPEGDYVFFEINPAGQYLWIEDQTGMPLSLAMANLLANPKQYALV